MMLEKINFNTESLLHNVNNCISNGLNDLLKDFLNDYNKYKKTHESVLKLAGKTSEFVIESNSKIITEEMGKYETLNQKIDEHINNTNTIMVKIVDKIEFLTNEIKSLKKMNVIDLTKDELFDYNKVKVKQEQVENENIQLKIEEIIENKVTKEQSEAEASEAEVSEAEEEQSEAEASEAEASEAEVSEAEEEQSEAEASEAEVSEAEEEQSEAEASEAEVSEAEEEKSEAEEEEEYMEIDIDDVTYCTNNEENGFIYEMDKDGDVGKKVGYIKDGEPFFYE